MGLGNSSFICNNKPVCGRTNEKIIKMVYGRRKEREEMKTGDTIKVKEFLELRKDSEMWNVPRKFSTRTNERADKRSC